MKIINQENQMHPLGKQINILLQRTLKKNILCQYHSIEQTCQPPSKLFDMK